MIWFPDNVRGTVMGLKQTGVTIGSAIAAIILPIIATNFSWRVSLQTTSAIVVISAIIFYILYPESPQQKRIERVLKLQTFRPLNFWFSASNRNIFILSLIMALFIAVQFSFGTFLVVVLIEVFNYPKVIAAQYLAVAFVTGTIGRISWGFISDFFFHGLRKPVLNLIALISAFASALFAFLSQGIEVSWILFPTALLGFSAMGFNAIYLTLISELAGKDQTGTSTGFTLSFAFLGAIFGPPFFGFLAQVFGTYSISWLFLTLLMILCFFGLRVIKEYKEE